MQIGWSSKNIYKYSDVNSYCIFTDLSSFQLTDLLKQLNSNVIR